MGLDMYAFAVHRKDKIDDFSIKPEAQASEFFYWRKNNALHAWMEQLYKHKKTQLAQTPETFNCEYLRLTTGDLLLLKQDIETGLKPTAGFFFGDLIYDKEDQEKDLLFVKTALEQIADDYCVYYYSWW